MKNFKIIFGWILVSILIVSCSKDDTPETPLKPDLRKNLLLKWSDSDDGLVGTYTYDNSNKVINFKLNGNVSNAPRNYNFIYNADGTLDKLLNAVDGTVIEKYTYNGDKKLIKKEDSQNVHQYTYTGNEVTDNYRSLATNSGWRQVYTYNSNGNLGQIKTYSNTSDASPLGTYSGVSKYTYDDKINASSSLPFVYMFPGSMVNNVKTNQYNNDAPTTNTYEYNADNYPVKRTSDYVKTYEYKRL